MTEHGKKTITEDIVRYTAKLSRIYMEEEDVVKFQGQLSGILDYIKQLDEVNTENTPPTAHALSSMTNVFREDELRESLPVGEALKNAPETKGNFFKVPGIIEE
ncbi:MAG: Asp-tRNA(Asn)/Glu-tRNA(Gln) amidotransferase subunit GatC [Candidatus Omnitrophota bacterium]